MSSRIAAIFVCGLAFTPLAGCRHGSAVPRQPSPVQQTARVEELASRFPGVDVIRTRTGGFLIRIRGVNTLLGANEPLYVVNGEPVHVDPQWGLDWLDPADIVRIEVLKYPADTNVYGPRGANGVILITTKRGR